MDAKYVLIKSKKNLPQIAKQWQSDGEAIAKRTFGAEKR
jgi:hypothetical protein